MTEAAIQTTRVNPRWLFKLLAFTVVAALFGVWGTYDALVAYPRRGERVAQFELLEYFDKADADGSLYRASVEDPAAEHDRLLALRGARGSASPITDLDSARLSWLAELAKVRNLVALTQENKAMAARPAAEQVDTTTRFTVPATTRDKLRTTLQGMKQPAPLSDYDIPFQYGIALVGFAIAGLVLWRIMKSAATKYSYAEAEHRLTLPGGRSITPTDIAVVDKREWHKFFVHLKLKDGTEHKLDLLRFVPLESWVLAMARHVEGYEEDAPEAAGEPEAT